MHRPWSNRARKPMPRKTSKVSIACGYLGLHQVTIVRNWPYRSSKEGLIALRLGCQRNGALRDEQH